MNSRFSGSYPKEVTEYSGSPWRIRNNEAHLHPMLHDWVERSGLLYEWYSDGYLSVDLPPVADDVKKVQILDELVQKGEISMEIVE